MSCQEERIHYMQKLKPAFVCQYPDKVALAGLLILYVIHGEQLLKNNAKH